MVAFRQADGRIRAVVVDGLPAYAEGIQVVLGALATGLEVSAVTITCNDALDAILEHSPDVVVVGGHVPDADGLQIAAAVRDHFPALKILMLPPSPSIQEASRAMRIGVNGYLQRDCDAEELVSAIKALVAGEIVIALPTVDALFSKSGSKFVHQDFSRQRAAIGIRRGGDLSD